MDSRRGQDASAECYVLCGAHFEDDWRCRQQGDRKRLTGYWMRYVVSVIVFCCCCCCFRPKRSLFLGPLDERPVIFLSLGGGEGMGEEGKIFLGNHMVLSGNGRADQSTLKE